MLDYNNTQPHLSARDIQYTAMAANWEDRAYLADFMPQMVKGMSICKNIRMTDD